MNSSMMTPQVSVVVPVYNGAWSIARCLDALLLERNDVSMEIIVVDDGSTDATYDILQGYEDRIKVIRQANSGLPGAPINNPLEEQ